MKTLLLSFSMILSGAVFAANPKYVFLFIGDGMSTPQRMAAEAFAEKTDHGTLAMNRLPYQTNTRTRSADAIITDSAAAGTAIACGAKTNNGHLGVDSKGNRLESVAALAKKAGRKVGIVTTVTIVHATPAAFYAHNPSRGASYQIGLDLVDSDFDYFAGGGVYDSADERRNPKYRGNLFELAAKAGYVVTRNDRAAWAALKPGVKSWSIFGDHGMDHAIDADGSQPNLAELVTKGIELLDNPNGFFLMCEGGKVDYAAHANDAGTNLRDVLDLDNAVKVALAFLEKHPDETLVVVTGDHETGGMSLGFAGIGGAFRVDRLAGQTISTERYSNLVKARLRETKCEITYEEMKADACRRYGLGTLSQTEDAQLRKGFDQDVQFTREKIKDTTAHDQTRRYRFARAAMEILNARAGIGWSSGAHTALPTLTTAKGVGADILIGMTDNTELGQRLKELIK